MSLGRFCGDLEPDFLTRLHRLSGRGATGLRGRVAPQHESRSVLAVECNWLEVGS